MIFWTTPTRETSNASPRHRRRRRLTGVFPAVDFELRVGRRGEIIAALAEGRLDRAIMGRPPREPVVGATALGPHPHIIVAAPDHPLAAVTRVDPAALLREAFLARGEGRKRAS